jgi:hypothetical protein
MLSLPEIISIPEKYRYDTITITMDMKPINRVRIWMVIGCFALIGMLTHGCVADDLSVCGISVHFKYTRNAQRVDKFATSINKINFYVFDKDSILVEEIVVEQSTLPEDFTLYVNIPPGTYDMIAWGNLTTDYEIDVPTVKGVTKKNDLILSLSRSGDTITNLPKELYYGGLDKIELIASDLQLQRSYTIDMMKDTKFIRVTAYGLAINTKAAGTNYDCTITAINGDLRFDNYTIGASQLQYIPQAVVDANHRLISEFSIVRELASGITQSRLLFTRTEYGTPAIMLDENLYPYLIAAAQQENLELDYKDTFEIELFFDETYKTATIVVDGWTVGQISQPMY